MKDSGGVLGEAGSGSSSSGRIASPSVSVGDPAIAPVPIPVPVPSPADVIDWTKAAASGMRESVTKEQVVQKKKWNTANLPSRIGIDVLAAVCAASLISPIIVTIDRGIMENASGKATLKDSIVKSIRTFLLRPHRFLFSKPFALIMCVYGGTYITANSIDTFSSTVSGKPSATTTHGLSKFLGTSASNLTLGIWKDAQLTKLFSTAAPGPIPKPTYLLFALRDSLTICASFNVPPLLAPHVPRELLPEFMKNVKSQSIAQFVAPAAVQLVSTPLHLLGLDMYNRGNIGMAERWKLVKGAWAQSCLARICRIVPAFGVGGVVNTGVRQSLMAKLEA